MSIGGALKRSISERFDDEIRFFRGWIDTPRTVGSVVPTSAITARRMASIVNPQSGLPVLELGPGTGVITRAILERGVKPQNLYCVEYSADFVKHLREQFPGINVIQGDAFDLDTTLGDLRGLTFDSVVSGVPLLNFPVAKRVQYVEGALDRLPAGRPMVQFSYGPFSPIPPRRGTYTVKHLDFVVRNFPPAQLWLYRRGAAGTA